MNKVKLYTVEIIMETGKSFSIETLGIYSSQEKAIEAIRALPMETEHMMYNIGEFILDDPPHNEYEDLSTEIKNLMDKGIIDQLIGEDGLFYYQLTDKGKEMAKVKRSKEDWENL